MPGILCVVEIPEGSEDPNWPQVEDVDQLSEQLREEVGHVFVAYEALEGREVSTAAAMRVRARLAS